MILHLKNAQKALALLKDFTTNWGDTPLKQRLRFLPKLTAISVAATLFATTPLSGNTKKSGTEPQNPTREETLLDIEPIVPIAIKDLLLQKMQEDLQTKAEQEQENKKYEEILESYRKNPPTIRSLLTDVWEDLGMSKEDAKTFVGDSFQNKNLLKTNIDKKVQLLYAEDDIFNAPTLKGLENYFRSLNNKRSLQLIIKGFNQTLGANIPPINLEKTSAEDLQTGWKNIKEFAMENPQAMELLQETKKTVDTLLKNKLQDAAGCAALEDNVFILSRKTTPKENFHYIATHEALHNGQNQTIPKELAETLEEIREKSAEKLSSNKTEKPHIKAILEKNPEREKAVRIKAAQEAEYLTSPEEIAAWSGMIKKVYFKDTNQLLSKKSNKEDLEKFHNWLQTKKFPSGTPENHILQTFQSLKSLMEQTPQTQKILQDNLKDVAQKQQKPHQPKQLRQSEMGIV